MMTKKLSILFSVCVFALFTACANAQPSGGGGQGQGPNFAEVAEKLGVTEEVLVEALGDSRPPNFAEAAEKLGITEEELMEVLPAPPEGGGRGGR